MITEVLTEKWVEALLTDALKHMLLACLMLSNSAENNIEVAGGNMGMNIFKMAIVCSGIQVYAYISSFYRYYEHPIKTRRNQNCQQF